MDPKTGFHEMRTNPRDIDKGASNTKYDQFKYLVKLMGPCNAPATFVTLRNEVLAGFIY